MDKLITRMLAKFKYLIIFIIAAALSILIVLSNYEYMELNSNKNYIVTRLNQEQELVNNRNYVVTALYAIEGILDSRISSELEKVNRQLPILLINDDFKLSTDMLWRYQRLQNNLAAYVSTDINNITIKQDLLLDVTAIKAELELVLKQNKTQHKLLLHNYNYVVHQLEQVFILSIISLIVLAGLMYYFMQSIKNDNKLRLLDLSNYNEKIDSSSSKDALVAIEHGCQRINYNNSVAVKSLSLQSELIAELKQENIKASELLAKLDRLRKGNGRQGTIQSSNKAHFKLYANIVNINKNIDEQLINLAQENVKLSHHMAKSVTVIKNIFKQSQKLYLVNLKRIVNRDAQVQAGVTHQDVK